MYTATKHPGRFEANRSELLARVLDDVIGNGFATDEIGECDTTGHYARIDGKRYSYIVETDGNGFVTYQIVPKSEIEKVWSEVTKTVEEMEAYDEANDIPHSSKNENFFVN